MGSIVLFAVVLAALVWNVDRAATPRWSTCWLVNISRALEAPRFTREREEGRIVGSILILASVLVVGCVMTRHTGEPGLRKKEGKASYYAGEYAGHATANGEIFDPEALTAAHRSLPFGTRVRVTRLDDPDEPSVVVRINDRGPFKRGRIIDLSIAAARKLRMVREGVVEVRLEVVSYPDGTEVSSSPSSGRAW